MGVVSVLKLYSSIRLNTWRNDILPDNEGFRTKVKVFKNKIAAPFKLVII